MRRRIAAVVALVVGIATVVLALVVAVSEFPRGLVLLGLVLLAGVSAWYGVLRRGIARVAGLGTGALALAGALAVLVAGGRRSWICWSWRACSGRWRPRGRRCPCT